ncbi:hypothetical protein [Pseudonocardia yunnanensis]|uniref:Uncharacterized protein n=1 Tax=Pseudonocardia yunnanensis TaxID=58107 RepID=A0ABW4F1F2_9PSEU
MTYRVDIDGGGSFIDLVVTQLADIAYPLEPVPPPRPLGAFLSGGENALGFVGPARLPRDGAYFIRLAEARPIGDQVLLSCAPEGRRD